VGAKTKEILALENDYVLQTYPRADFVLEKGEGAYLFDSEGRKYLDFAAGYAVNALGHGDPEILAAIERQAKRVLHVSVLHHSEPHIRLSELLAKSCFAQRAFYANSGAESVEAAMKFSRRWARVNFGPDKHEFVAFRGSFHGRTFGALSTTWPRKWRAPFEPLLPGVRFATFNDLASASQTVDDRTCAVIVEPIQADGGCSAAKPEFLSGLRELCDRHNALLVFDEIQCGLGRTGLLWAHEFYDVYPDIMCAGKSLGGGLPLSATLVTERVAEAIELWDHATTHSANPLACAVAQVVVRRVSDPAFLATVREKGERLQSELRGLQDTFPTVTDVLGRGLLLGVEVTANAWDLIARGYTKGVLIVNAGDHVLRLLPPLVIEDMHIAEFIDKLRWILADPIA
jgi:acetylornithine/N-succinyldiaminopimelate aminotransferase